MEKWEIRPPLPKKPEPIVTKFCMGDYVGDRYSCTIFYHDRITPFRPQMCENSLQVTRLVFWRGGRYFRQRTTKTPVPIFTINTSNNVVSRKDVSFGGSENKVLYFVPTLAKKEMLGQFLTGLRKFRVKKALTLPMLT